MNDYHPWLSAHLPGEQSCTWPLQKKIFIIGREAPADLALPILSISRQHARIEYEESRFTICDLGSRNGTFLNGKALGRDPQLLYDGDLIVLGGALTFQFHDPGGTVEAPRVGLLNGVWIDPSTQDVWVDACRVKPPLSPAQLSLLELLYRSPGQVVSHMAVIAAVWPGEDPEGISKDAVNSLIKRLRARLRRTQPEQEYIEVLRGHGLRLIPGGN